MESIAVRTDDEILVFVARRVSDTTENQPARRDERRSSGREHVSEGCERLAEGEVVFGADGEVSLADQFA
jgi:hypothetical protein